MWRSASSISVSTSSSVAAAASSAASRVNIAMSVATWSLRERAVCSLPARLAGELGDASLDRHVHVLVTVGERERSVAYLVGDRRERGVQGLAVLFAE